MKTLFVYNPNAGHMQLKSNLWDIINTLSNTYSDLSIYTSKKPKDVTKYLKKNANKFDLVVVSGGDGTLSEAVNGLMTLENRPKLGYIPAGSTNDYATSLKIPKDMKKAAYSIVSSKKVNKIDVGKFNSNYFVYVAAFGAFTEVAYNTPQDIKRVLGHLAYLLNGISSISKIRSYKLSIKTKNNELSGNYIYGMITNTLSIGGIYQFNKKDVKLDDGEFEVTLVKKPNDLFELNEITAYLVDPKLKTSLVQTFKTDSLTIESKTNLSFTLDGENGGTHKKVVIKNINKAINFVK